MEKKNKTKQKYLDSSKKWKQDNKERVKSQKDEWLKKNPEKRAEYRDNILFGGNSQAVLERDNFECQECGMTQEQHIIIFGTRLAIHHKDGNGRRNPNPNNDIDNLLTMCHDCHTRLHLQLKKLKRWGELLEQDDTDWKYPKLRDIVWSKVSDNVNITEAKKIVADELNVSFWTIDGYCYEKKLIDDDLSGEREQ